MESPTNGTETFRPLDERAYSAALRACARRYLPWLGGHGNLAEYLADLECVALENGRVSYADQIAADRPATLAFAARASRPKEGTPCQRQ